MTQCFTKCVFRQRRQYPEGAGGQKHAVGDQSMDVRVESHEVAEGLHVEDKGWLSAPFHGLEAGFQQSGNQLAQCTQRCRAISGPRQSAIRAAT